MLSLKQINPSVLEYYIASLRLRTTVESEAKIKMLTNMLEQDLVENDG